MFPTIHRVGVFKNVVKGCQRECFKFDKCAPTLQGLI